MSIDAVGKHPFISQRTKVTGHATGQAGVSTSFSAILNASARQTPSADSDTPRAVDRVDFTDMTRQEMHAWINRQLRNGNMSFVESRTFLGLTFGTSDMATDTTRIDFIDRASQGFEWALSRNDRVMAERLQKVVETLYKLSSNDRQR